MITLVKFIRNRKVGSDNYLVTRTLGKVGVVKREVYEEMNPKPQHDEFWFAEIMDEVHPGKVKGCWILRPIKKVGTVNSRGFNEPDIVRLIPGTFYTENRGNTIYVYPSEGSVEKGPNWILDIDVRKALTSRFRKADGSNPVSSIVVVFDEPPPPQIVEPPREEDALDPILDLASMEQELDDGN
jgi:hypothetical protein